MKVALVLIMAAVCYRSVYSACSVDPIVQTDKTNIDGIKGKISFCRYQGADILVGSTWKNNDCTECSCEQDGLHCCSFGVGLPFDGPIRTRKCVLRSNNCELEWVKKRNKNKKCPMDPFGAPLDEA